MNTVRILNLETAEEDSRRLRAALEEHFDVAWGRAADEGEYRACLASDEWDLVIARAELPDLSGVEAHEILTDEGHTIPVIILADDFDPKAAVAAMTKGVSDYLPKDDLARVVPAAARELFEAENRRAQRAAEKALAQSEDRLRLALRAAGIGAWEWDLKTDDIYWSPEASVIFGIPVAGSKGSVLRELIFPEDAPGVDRATKTAVETRRSFDVRFRIRRKGGDMRWVAASGKCEFSEKGEPIKVFGTIRDITRDKKAEIALQDAEERYRIMAETAADGVLSIDEQDTILFVNPSLEKMLGFTREELLGKSMSSLVPERYRQRHIEGMKRYLETGRKQLDWRSIGAVVLRKDGTEVSVQISFGEYRKGEKVLFTGFLRDVTLAKQQEEALRRSEHDFRALVEATTHYVWQNDEDGRPYGPLGWWEDLTGQPVTESTQGHGWADFIHPDDRERVERRYAESLATGQPLETEARILDRSGRYRYYLASAVPITGPAGTRWIGALKDIHDQRAVEQRYRIVSTISSDYVFSGRIAADGETKIDWLTGAFERITGYQIDEFNERGGWRAIVHPDDRERDLSDFMQLVRNEEVETEVRILNAAGEVVWVRVCAQPVWDSQLGRVTGVYGAVTDITERKSAELAVREREAYLNAMLAAEPECVKVISPDGKLLDVNPAGLAMMEADSPEQIIGQAGMQVLSAADEATFKRAVERAMAGETVTVSYRITALKGTRRWLEMCAAPIRDAEGNITSVLGVSRDITEKQRIEAALIESEKQYADLLNTVEGIVWEVDAETMRFTFVSRQAETILGYPITQWYEENFWVEHIHPDDRERTVSYCEEQSAKGEGHTFEYRMFAKDGRVVWLRDIVSVVMDAGKPKILRGVMVDVTEQRRLDAAMKQQALLIEQSNEAIFVWDLDAGVIEWNRGCEKLYGFTRAEMLNKYPYEVLRTAFPNGPEAFLGVLKEDGVWAGEVTQTTRSGEPVLVDSRAQLIELGGRKAVLQTSRDITEVRRAEDALRRSELRYRHLFENNPYPMWVYDVETLRFLAVNDSAVQHYGYTADEFRAMKITDIRPSEDASAVVERSVLASRLVDSSGGWRHLKKDGTLINVHITSHALDFEGRRARLVLASDVTDRLRAEEALRSSEAKYRELVSNANDIIYTHDLTGRFTSLNHAGERTTGYTEAEAKLMNIADVVPPEYMEQARVMVEKKLATGVTATIYETELIAKDGRRIPLEVNSRLIFENGKPVAVQGIARDFTERRRAEEELQQQRERLDKTAEAAPVVICTLRLAADGTSAFQFASKASSNVFGFSPEALEQSGEPVFARIDPDHLRNIEAAMAEAIESGVPLQVTYNYEHPERGRIWIETYATPTFDKDGSQLWHGIAADVTEHKNAEAALLASEEQLRQAQKLESIGILAGGLAHDFNNMLTAINGYSDLILRRVPADDPVRRHVEEIKKAGERSADLTRQLLAFSRRQILQPSTIDLNGVIADTASMLKRLIGEDITITTMLAPDLRKIQADQGQFAQVLMNLLINARDAMPNGGSVMIETANIELDRDYSSKHLSVAPGRYVMLAISDTGVGMDEQTRQRVFEPFFTTKPVGRGTGLGLSTVYGIVKQSGGNIWVYSEPGRGSTFKIYLPQAAQEAAAGAETSVGQPEIQVGSERILLVEDEDSVRGLARQILEACGYEVFEASNGVEAFAMFENIGADVDLLVTDIVMPEMGGRELSERVLGRRPGTKVLFTSGYTDDAIIRHGIIDEGKNFLQKPFTFDALARKVRSVLDGRGNTGRLKAIGN